MYFDEFNLLLETLPPEPRIIQYRKRDSRTYVSGVILPPKPGTTGYTFPDLICDELDMYIIGCWPISDVVRVMSCLYTIESEIIGEV